MNLRKKLIDYITGVAVVGAISLVSFVLHVLFPKNGHGSTVSIQLFSPSFWVAWTSLMLVFALFYALWVFFLYNYNLAGRSRSR